MATLKSDILLKKDASAIRIADGILPTGKLTGTILYATAAVNVTSALAANDVLELIEIPIGSTIIPALSRVVNDAAGSVTMDIGYTDYTPDGTPTTIATAYSSAVPSTNNSNLSFLTNGTQGAEPPETKSYRKLIATAKAGTSAAAGKLTFLIALRCAS